MAAKLRTGFERCRDFRIGSQVIVMTADSSLLRDGNALIPDPDGTPRPLAFHR
jgi:hypothetical protein